MNDCSSSMRTAKAICAALSNSLVRTLPTLKLLVMLDELTAITLPFLVNIGEPDVPLDKLAEC